MTTKELNKNKQLSEWLLKAGEEFELDGKKYTVVRSDDTTCGCREVSADLGESWHLCGQAPICNIGSRSLVGGDSVHFVLADSEKCTAPGKCTEGRA